MTDDTTAPEATQAPTEPTTTAPAEGADLAAELEKLTAKYERAQKDLAKFRTRAEEVEAANKAAAEKALSEKTLAEQLEALKARLAEQERAATEAQAAVTRERGLRQLEKDVVDADLAYLAARELNLIDEDGNVRTDELLKAKPYLARPAQAHGVNIPGARNAKRPALTLEDVAKMTPEQVNERWDDIQALYKAR